MEKAMTNLVTCRQGANEDLATYQNRFRNARKVMRVNGGQTGSQQILRIFPSTGQKPKMKMRMMKISSKIHQIE
jgi:hypothetical protein